MTVFLLSTAHATPVGMATERTIEDGVDGAGSGWADLGAWLVVLVVVALLADLGWWARGSRRRR
jgi:hypothetical protein